MSRLFAAALRPSDLAIDVGTATVRFASIGAGTGECRAFAAGRRALAGGVIVDQDAAVDLFTPIIRQARGWIGLSRVRALACAPTDATSEEKAALAECLAKAGASAVFISPEPLAAAIGGRVDVACRHAKVIIDIGEGVTDCAVLRSGQVMASRAVRKGCGALRGSIRVAAAEANQVELTESEAESVLRRIDLRGCGRPGIAVVTSTARGLRCVTMCAELLRVALEPDLAVIVQTVRQFTRELPSVYAVEAIEDGIFLTGGGALIKGMRERIAAVTGMDVHTVADPLRAVVNGARAMLPAAAALRVWKA